MNFLSLFVTFLLALITFYVNHRIQKFTNIKIVINSLFDIYGSKDSFDNFNHSEAASRLMDEIINIEKLNDNNFYVNLELAKLKKLRLVYFHFKSTEESEKQIEDIGFSKLDKSFIILSFLDIKIPYYR